jgi:hypothetical protein
MSDAAVTPPSQQSAPAGDYETRTIHHDGYDYTFSFYKGFASRVTYTPAGGDPIEVYQQEGVFNCRHTGGPVANSFLSISGGPDTFDIQVDIADGPLTPPDFRGPIEGFQLGLKRRGTPVQPKPRVKPVRGADQISRITVRERGAAGSGGVMAFQDGDSVDVENAAQTCPPTCN